MDIIIKFFRDVLDGPLYFLLVIISLFLLVVCIIYLLNSRKKPIKAVEEIAAQTENITSNMNYSTGVDYTNTIINLDDNNKQNYSGDVYNQDNNQNNNKSS